MTAREAAVQLELRPSTVYALCRSGELGHMRVGTGARAIRLDQSDVDEYRRRARERASGPVPEPPPAYVLRNFRPQARR